jgi:hypothetical protein
MSQEKSTPVSEVSNKEGNSEDCGHEVNGCTCPPDKEYVKFTRIRGLTNLLGMINFMPPFDSPISYTPLEKMWSFKKQIREIDPNWLLADEITLLEHQVLNQIDVIDINVPWNSARNKLRYIDLYQTITKLRTIHPDWQMYLEDSKNHHFCKCYQCSEVKRQYQEALDATSSEELSSDEESRK